MIRKKIIIKIIFASSCLLLISQFLINFYIYPGVLPDPFLKALHNTSASITDTAENNKEIVVNLRNKVLDVFENGQFIKRYPVAGYGHPKIYPTPLGDFEILTKYSKAFSKSSQVWMPWSMRFYGQYYFHGIPYLKSGAKIKSVYSHGCIRLPDNIAEEMYAWTEIGTKVKVFYARLAREEGSDTVFYLTENGFKRPILNPEVFSSYQNRWNEVEIVKKGMLTGYPDTKLIRATDDITVFLLENGKKRPIKNMETFKNLSFKWEEVAPVNKTELNAWPTGEAIEISEEKNIKI